MSQIKPDSAHGTCFDGEGLGSFVGKKHVPKNRKSRGVQRGGKTMNLIQMFLFIFMHHDRAAKRAVGSKGVHRLKVCLSKAEIILFNKLSYEPNQGQHFK